MEDEKFNKIKKRFDFDLLTGRFTPNDYVKSKYDITYDFNFNSDLTHQYVDFFNRILPNMGCTYISTCYPIYDAIGVSISLLNNHKFYTFYSKLMQDLFELEITENEIPEYFKELIENEN